MNDFVFLNCNEQELLEIDYDMNVAFNISELKIVENENKMTKYVGTIEDYLRGKGFTVVHYHETGSLPSRAHYGTKHKCSFR
jgi:hypothetical protein